MDWVLRSPQIHSIFGSLGFERGETYHVNENCNSALETILQNILAEDKYLRTYRRSISLGQNIKRDLIPLLIHAKEDRTIELLLKILVNLTIPIECLLSVDVISKTDFGRHSIFEINNLLTSAKVAFTDQRASKVIIDFIKKNADFEQQSKLNPEQCANISNSLLLFRNILHIPEEPNTSSPSHSSPTHMVQNQILWNIFSQSIDKILIKLMTVPEAANWAVTMVQLIALLYKDQHVVTLHKLLNLWLEASLSESSEDNESNTSPPDRGSESSLPLLTSDPTSDSSDTGASGKSNDDPSKDSWETKEVEDHQFQAPPPPPLPLSPSEKNKESDESSKTIEESAKNCDFGSDKEMSSVQTVNDLKKGISESDCGYGTQIENQGSISTSSNEDDMPASKPVHQKLQHPKQRASKLWVAGDALQDRRRKKIVKRSKANIINVQGLTHQTPTDDDISNVLKEFTVDFLLKGYNSLVETLHSQILTNRELEIDTSHFFWLVTYFLKFATQIELDLEHVCSVLSFEMVSYLTAEGVNLCEQFELAIKLGGHDLKPNVRRLHLVVTAIRELVQAIEVYKKFGHMCSAEAAALRRLQQHMCDAPELRSLLVLLLRLYNPKYHSKQYLQDLIVTNHILLLFIDSGINSPDYQGSTNMMTHIKQFATPEIMQQYGLLLEEYKANGEFVNDCIFTLMHHVGGALGSLIALFQPTILKSFASIWKSEFEICDDWSDLIEYVINTFVKKPQTLHSEISFKMAEESFEEDAAPRSRVDWTEQEISTLSWNFMQCSTSNDIIGDIVKLFKDDGNNKSEESIMQELLKQNLIDKDEFENLQKIKCERSAKIHLVNKENRDDEIGKLCEQLIQDGKLTALEWVQKVLLDTCFAKICLEKEKKNFMCNEKLLDFEVFKSKVNEISVVSSISYHSLLLNQSIPLVPWNCEQASVCKDLKFLQLLHKLGFYMPVDTGKLFIRIPHFWTPDLMYEFAGKILPIPLTCKIQIPVDGMPDSCVIEEQTYRQLTAEIKTPENIYQIQKQNHLAHMVHFTPMPGSSFNSDNIGGNNDSNSNWLDIVQKSQKIITSPNIESVCETASVASDLTRMYVSDEDEKMEVLLSSNMEVNMLEDTGSSDLDVNARKRLRDQFSSII